MIEHAGTSDQGRVRFRNEDFIAWQMPDDPDLLLRRGSLFVIADGVGGSNAGNIASSEAAQTLLSIYYGGHGRPERALKDAFTRANLHVYDLGLRGGKMRMETTMSAIALLGSRALIVHVGDSRIYRVRGEQAIELLTRDHSEVAELVKMQILSPENARHHPRRHVITRSVGNGPILHPLFREETVLPGDIFVLCTDGIWEPVEDAEIAAAAAAHSPQAACQSLINLGLARQTNDNLSVQVIKVVSLDKENEGGEANNNGWWPRLRRSLGLSS